MEEIWLDLEEVLGVKNEPCKTEEEKEFDINDYVE